MTSELKRNNIVQRTLLTKLHFIGYWHL